MGRGVPLGVQLRVGEDSGDDAGTVDGRVRVHGTDENLELALDGLGLGLGGGEEGKGSNTLS